MCDRLLAEGHTVVALDNFLTGAPRNISSTCAVIPTSNSASRTSRGPFTVEGAVDGAVNMASPASPKDYLETPHRDPRRGQHRQPQHA